jgi:hypothetical protein
MSFFNSLKAKIASVFNDFVSTVKSLADSFLPKAGKLAEAAIEDVFEIAATAVLTQAPKVISGQEKFSNAVDVVVKSVTAQGKTIAINTAQAAVQLAYLEAVRIAKENK